MKKPKEKKSLLIPRPKRVGSLLSEPKKVHVETRLKLKPLKDKDKLLLKRDNDIINDTDSILLGEFDWMGGPPMYVYFNTRLQHFYIKYKDKDGEHLFGNLWTVSFVKGLCKALRRAARKNLITTGYAPPPPEEEED